MVSSFRNFQVLGTNFGSILVSVIVNELPVKVRLSGRRLGMSYRLRHLWVQSSLEVSLLDYLFIWFWRVRSCIPGFITQGWVWRTLCLGEVPRHKNNSQCAIAWLTLPSLIIFAWRVKVVGLGRSCGKIARCNKIH